MQCHKLLADKKVAGEEAHLLGFCRLLAHDKGIAFQASDQVIILRLGQCSCCLLDGPLQRQ